MELERRIGLRRDAPRAPIPVPEWLRAAAHAVARNAAQRPRPTLAYSKRKMVLTKGSTLHFLGKSQGFKAFLIEKMRAISVAVQIGSRYNLQVRLLKFVSSLERFLEDSPREKISHLKSYERLPTPGRGRTHICFEANERNSLMLKQSSTFDLDRINQ